MSQDTLFLKLLRDTIRNVPNFPKPGIQFKDITPVFHNPELVRACVQHLVDPFRFQGVTKVAGIESRGFLLGPMIAQELHVPFVFIRKKGKLPVETSSREYELEYGTATIEVQKSCLTSGDKVLIHDDLLATGGTAQASAELIQQVGAQPAGFSFLVDLNFLPGRDKLAQYQQPIHSLVSYGAGE